MLKWLFSRFTCRRTVSWYAIQYRHEPRSKTCCPSGIQRFGISRRAFRSFSLVNENAIVWPNCDLPFTISTNKPNHSFPAFMCCTLSRHKKRSARPTLWKIHHDRRGQANAQQNQGPTVHRVLGHEQGQSGAGVPRSGAGRREKDQESG